MQVVAGLLCLVCPVCVLPRRQSVACLPLHSTLLQSMIPVALRRFTPAMYAPGLGFLMLAVGINLRLECFREVFKRPKVRSGVPARQRLSATSQWLRAVSTLPLLYLLTGQSSASSHPAVLHLFILPSSRPVKTGLTAHGRTSWWGRSGSGW